MPECKDLFVALLMLAVSGRSVLAAAHAADVLQVSTVHASGWCQQLYSVNQAAVCPVLLCCV